MTVTLGSNPFYFPCNNHFLKGEKIMSRVVFQVSRYAVGRNPQTNVVTKEQLRLKERYNSQREQVTAMATMHMQGEEPWLSGMHYCYIDNVGDQFFSFNKEEGVDFKVDFNINFQPKQLNNLRKQLESLGERITRPAKDEEGVSQLRGIQLHVILTEDAEFGLNMKEDAKFGDRLQKKIQPHFIKEVKLVTASDAEYVQAPDTQVLSADLAIQSLYQAASKEEVKKPESKDEAKAAILGMMSSRKAKREAFKQAARTSASIKPPAEASISLSLVDDEDQPE